MNYLLTGGLMGWLIGERLPPYIFDIGDYRNYLCPLNAEGFANWIDDLLGLYDPAINSVQLNLLDSHDTSRFITTAGGDKSALKLGWLFLFTYIGAPCIYYGDEVGLSGGPDPACRGAFPWNEKDWDQELHDFVKQLIKLRLDHPALRRGTYQRLYARDDVFAYSRRSADETVIVVINAGLNISVTDIPLSLLNQPEGPIKILFGETYVNVEGGNLNGLRLGPRSGVVLGT